MSSRARAFSRTQRMERSSSTIQTVFMVALSWCIYRCLNLVAKGQQDGEAGAPRLAVHFNEAVVLLDEALGQGQAQAAAPFPPGHQGIENLVADALRDTRAVVDDLQFQCQAETPLGKGDLARHPGAQADLALPLEGLGRIAGDVEDGLDELFPVGVDLRQAGVVVPTDVDRRELR